MKASILAFALVAAASASARPVFIGIDVSKSNPVAVDEDSAKAASDYLYGVVATLQLGDEVHIQTFGDRSSAHASKRSVRLGRKHKPEMVAAQVAQYVRSLPAKPLQGQSETQILAFFELSSLQCDQGGLAIVLTDGIESSPGIREKDLLAGKPLPSPEAGSLTGCEVVMFGLGRSKDGSVTREQAKKLKASWSLWMKDAGARFTAITG